MLDFKTLPWRLLKWICDWMPQSVIKKIEQCEKRNQSLESLNEEIMNEFEDEDDKVSRRGPAGS